MPQMSTSSARIVDPVLSTVARGYKNAALVYQALFPVVPVGQRGGKIITFGREAFRIYNTGRSPGQNTKRIQIGYEGSPFVLEQHALEGMLPVEVQEESEAAVPGIDMAGGTVTTTQDIIELRTEQAAAAMATNLASYPTANKKVLSGSSKWTDPASTPTADVEDGKEVVRSIIGRRPNTAVISARAFKACKNNPSIIDRIKYTGRDSITLDILANLWEIPRVVLAESVYEDATGTMQDCWGSDVVLAYTEIGTVTDRGRPSYGYTYRLRNYPIVEQPYFDRPSKSWVYPVTDELQPVIAGAQAGYLIKAAG